MRPVFTGVAVYAALASGVLPTSTSSYLHFTSIPLNARTWPFEFSFIQREPFK
jgi:hypothetical protein